MNNDIRKTIVGAILCTTVGVSAMLPAVYKSIKISSDAHARVKEYSVAFGIPMKQAASRMILDYTPYPGYKYIINWPDQVCWEDEKGLKEYQGVQRSIASSSPGGTYNVIEMDRCTNK